MRVSLVTESRNSSNCVAPFIDRSLSIWCSGLICYLNCLQKVSNLPKMPVFHYPTAVFLMLSECCLHVRPFWSIFTNSAPVAFSHINVSTVLSSCLNHMTWFNISYVSDLVASSTSLVAHTNVLITASEFALVTTLVNLFALCVRSWCFISLSSLESFVLSVSSMFVLGLSWLLLVLGYCYQSSQVYCLGSLCVTKFTLGYCYELFLLY